MAIKKNKNILRLCLTATISLLIFSIVKLSFSYETVINDKLHFSLPAAVYVSSDEKLTFDYSDIFKAYTQHFQGGEITYHVDLISNDKGLHGYVEVWSFNDSLPVFLEKAKAAFSPSISNFNESFPSGDINSREWTYNVKSQSGEAIHARQYFTLKNGNLIVVSLFAPQRTWSSKQDKMFEEIKNSTKLI